MAVIAIVVRESRFREKATRFDEAVDRPLRCLVPTDIESEQLRKELQLAVWQIVMNPPCHCLPARGVHSIYQPRHNDRRQRAHAAVFACRCIGILHLEPIGRAAGTIGAVFPLRDNAFEAESRRRLPLLCRPSLMLLTTAARMRAARR